MTKRVFVAAVKDAASRPFCPSIAELLHGFDMKDLDFKHHLVHHCSFDPYWQRIEYNTFVIDNGYWSATKDGSSRYWAVDGLRRTARIYVRGRNRGPYLAVTYPQAKNRVVGAFEDLDCIVEILAKSDS